jgi:prevent-host-death family protein
VSQLANLPSTLTGQMLYNMKTLRIPIAEARKNFAEVMREVQSGTRVKLTRYNKTLVALISNKDLKILKECEEQGPSK